MRYGRTFLSVMKLGLAVLYLTGCGGIGSLNLSNVSLSCTTAQISAASLTITPTVVSVPAGTSVTFASTEGSGVTSQPVWSFSAIAGTSTDRGSLNPSGQASSTVTYTAPATPPVYSQIGVVQGQVNLLANATNNVGCFASSAATTSFLITAPTVTVGLTPATASVALGSTMVFEGYAVGSLNNGLTWQINGMVNGSPTYGTLAAVNAEEVYTAPAAMPVSGPNVTITMTSVADPTKVATAVVTLH
jgi:hypothetical protein